MSNPSFIFILLHHHLLYSIIKHFGCIIGKYMIFFLCTEIFILEYYGELIHSFQICWCCCFWIQSSTLSLSCFLWCYFFKIGTYQIILIIVQCIRFCCYSLSASIPYPDPNNCRYKLISGPEKKETFVVLWHKCLWHAFFWHSSITFGWNLRLLSAQDIFLLLLLINRQLICMFVFLLWWKDVII